MKDPAGQNEQMDLPRIVGRYSLRSRRLRRQNEREFWGRFTQGSFASLATAGVSYQDSERLGVARAASSLPPQPAAWFDTFVTSNVVRTYLVALVCCLFVFLIGCTHSSSKMFDPASPRLAQKLGIGKQDWCEIRDLIEAEHNLALTYVERTRDGCIGAWMSTQTAKGLEKHGPVFFYAKYQDRWYRLDEMSEWREPTGNQKTP